MRLRWCLWGCLCHSHQCYSWWGSGNVIMTFGFVKGIIFMQYTCRRHSRGCWSCQWGCLCHFCQCYIHGEGLEMSLWHLVLSKDHFDVTYVCVGGIYVVPDYVYWDVWVIYLSAIHGGDLDMASWQLRLSQGPIWYIGTLSGIVQIHLWSNCCCCSGVTWFQLRRVGFETYS